METILFRKKQYEVLQKLSEQTYKVAFKGKTYIMKVFHQGSLEFPTFVRQTKRLKIAGVRIPKIVKLDKKEEKALVEYITGHNMLDVINERELNETELKAIFEQAWFAECDHITLDYHPDNFVMTDKNTLYYLNYDYTNGVDDKLNFKTTYVKLWFFTKEYVNYAKTKGLTCDLSRLKDEYAMNKEIVLAVVKYYM